jgi:hypothetical protein
MGTARQIFPHARIMAGVTFKSRFKQANVTKPFYRHGGSGATAGACCGGR